MTSLQKYQLNVLDGRRKLKKTTFFLPAKVFKKGTSKVEISKCLENFSQWDRSWLAEGPSKATNPLFFLETDVRFFVSICNCFFLFTEVFPDQPDESGKRDEAGEHLKIQKYDGDGDACCIL